MASAGQKYRGRRLGFWLFLAALLHAELLLVIGVGIYLYAPRNSDLMLLRGNAGEEQIEIATMDDETARKMLAELDKAEEKAKEEEVKKEIDAVQPPGQVVDLAKPREEKRPDQAKFAAEYDSSVEKETRKFGRFDRRARQGDSAGQAEQSTPAGAPPGAPVPPTPQGAAARRMAMRESAPTKSASQQQPRPPEPATAPAPGEDGPPQLQDPDGALLPGGKMNPQPRVAVQPPAGGPAGARPLPAPGSPALTPSQQQLARAIGSGTQDRLQDIEDGEETVLNAKKWKFASFFNRVKAQVQEHWRPGDVYRRRDPTGAIYGNKDRYTLLHVQLKPDGSLANVVLETPSGVEFLDDEAIEAFKEAQPFPNPPPQLVKSGTIDFRFGFFFELSGVPKLRPFYRYDPSSM
jgi:TonB family protein